MSGIIEECEKCRSIRILDDLLDEFFEGRYDEIKLIFDRPLELNENEYYGLIGSYDSSNGAEGLDVFYYDLGVFEDSKTGKCYKVSKVLEIELSTQENGVYTIRKIVGHTVTSETECRDKED